MDGASLQPVVPTPPPSPPSSDRKNAWTPPSGTPEPKEEEPLPVFRPMPGLFVFPNLPLVGFWFNAGGLSKKSATLLAWSYTPSAACAGFLRCGYSWLGLGVLLFTFGMMLLALALLLNFAFRFRGAMWVSAKPPVNPVDVADPLLRLWSRLKAFMLRMLCCNRCTPSPANRIKGKWAGSSMNVKNRQ